MLVTDAIRAMGLPEGTYTFGQQTVEIRGKRAMLKGTDTLAGRYSGTPLKDHPKHQAKVVFTFSVWTASWIVFSCATTEYVTLGG